MLVQSSRRCCQRFCSKRSLVLTPTTVHKCAQKPCGPKYDENAFVRTNVLADYIEKLTNDINMVSLGESDDSEYHCKYIACIHCILIIAIMVFMFFDNNKPED
jgi:hypothetical protein